MTSDMYADILRSKRTLGWRTCLIVPELTAEIITHKRSRAQRSELLAFRREQFRLESHLDKIKTATVTLDGNSSEAQIGQGQRIGYEENEELRERLEFLRTLIRHKLEEYNRAFHPNWGPLFKAGFQESRFAIQVKLVHIYTSYIIKCWLKS